MLRRIIFLGLLACTLFHSVLAQPPPEGIDWSSFDSDEGPTDGTIAPQPAPAAPQPAQEAPQPAQAAPQPAQAAPQPAQQAPQPAQEAPQPAQDAPLPAQEAPLPAQEAPQPAPQGASDPAPQGASKPAPQRTQGCPQSMACPGPNGLGIQYGHCYTLQDTNGKQLGRELSQEAGWGVTYNTGGEVNNIVFRVCKTTTDCTLDKDKEVPHDGSWNLQDLNGKRTQQGTGWFGDLLPHMGLTQDAGKAAKFIGGKYCYEGKCAICLRRYPGKGIDSPCPGLVHLGGGDNANDMSCKAYYFWETECWPWAVKA